MSPFGLTPYIFSKSFLFTTRNVLAEMLLLRWFCLIHLITFRFASLFFDLFFCVSLLTSETESNTNPSMVNRRCVCSLPPAPLTPCLTLDAQICKGIWGLRYGLGMKCAHSPCRETELNFQTPNQIADNWSKPFSGLCRYL